MIIIGRREEEMRQWKEEASSQKEKRMQRTKESERKESKRKASGKGNEKKAEIAHLQRI